VGAVMPTRSAGTSNRTGINDLVGVSHVVLCRRERRDQRHRELWKLDKRPRRRRRDSEDSAVIR
jgi:hypothetical protein